MAPLHRTVVLAALGIGAVQLLRSLRTQPSYSFYDKSVVITGGSRGLGLVMARQLAAEGANLTLMARDPHEVARAAQELADLPIQVLSIAGDVRNQVEAQQMIDAAMQRFGRVDVLINNAGVIQTGPIEHMTVEDFREALAVHTMGPLYTMLAAVPYMRRQGGGRIVNICSIGGKVAVPHMAPYVTSKHALAGLSAGMRAELAKDNIRVMTVFPGLMRTGSHMNALFKGRHAQEFTWFSVLDSLPLVSIDARRAASLILEACQRGDAQVTISVAANVLALINALVPNVMADALKLMNQFLPDPTDASGDITQTGWESRSPLAPSLLTRLSDEATKENNGLAGRMAVR